MLKFSCEKALLSNAVSITSRAVASKSAIPALEGILLNAESELRLTGYNLETGIRTLVSAEISSQGAVVISARLFGDIVRRLPDDIVTIMADDRNMVNIECGMSKFDIAGMSPDEYPEMPVVEDESGITLTQRSLRAMISQSLFAVSDSDLRPIHTGSLFEVEGETLTMVSVDGYRLALRREALSSSRSGDGSFVVPGSALSEVEKICADSDEDVEITAGSKHVVFHIGVTTLVSRRLEGEFLNYRQAIPRGNPTVIPISAQELIESVERVSLIINDRVKTPVRCAFGGNVINLSTNTTLGSATDCCRSGGSGGDLEIGFNNRYLLEALKAAPVDAVKIELNNGISPCIIVPAEGEENFLFMILPVRLK